MHIAQATTPMRALLVQSWEAWAQGRKSGSPPAQRLPPECVVIDVSPQHPASIGSRQRMSDAELAACNVNPFLIDH